VSHTIFGIGFQKEVAMSRRILMLLVVFGGLIGLLASKDASAAVVFNTRFPINLSVAVPCANEGAGEVVELSGDLHDLFSYTIDSNGGVHLDVHDNPQGVSGTGLTTGDRYRATGVTRFNLNSTDTMEVTLVNNFRVIGQGPGNNLLVHDNLHVTVNANGELTASHDNFRVECK
jgi:hypothetical protein